MTGKCFWSMDCKTSSPRVYGFQKSTMSSWSVMLNSSSKIFCTKSLNRGSKEPTSGCVSKTRWNPNMACEVRSMRSLLSCTTGDLYCSLSDISTFFSDPLAASHTLANGVFVPSSVTLYTSVSKHRKNSSGAPCNNPRERTVSACGRANTSLSLTDASSHRATASNSTWRFAAKSNTYCVFMLVHSTPSLSSTGKVPRPAKPRTSTTTSLACKRSASYPAIAESTRARPCSRSRWRAYLSHQNTGTSAAAISMKR